MGGFWYTRRRAWRGVRGSNSCAVDGTMDSRRAASGNSEDLLMESRSGGGLCARVHREDVGDAAESGRATPVGVSDRLADLGKSEPRGEVGESKFNVSMWLVHRGRFHQSSGRRSLFSSWMG